MNDGDLSPFQIDTRLRRISGHQLGLVTVAQAGCGGVDKWALERRREAGALEPVFAGVMRLTAAPTTTEQRILGAGLAVPCSMTTGTSAGIVHQLPIGSSDHQPMVSVALERSARTAGVVTIRHRALCPASVG